MTNFKIYKLYSEFEVKNPLLSSLLPPACPNPWQLFCWMLGTSPYPPLPSPATQSFSMTTDLHTQTDTSIYMLLKLQKFQCKRMQNLQEFSSGTWWDNHSSHCLLQLGVILKLLPLHAFSFGEFDLYLRPQQSISALSWHHLYFQVCSWLVIIPESTPFTDNKRKSYSAT